MKACAAVLFGIAFVGATRAADDSAAETIHRASVATDGLQRVSIEGGAYFFDPNRVIVKSGVPVELTVSVGPGVIPHSFVIQAPEAGIVVDEALSTRPVVIRFTPTTVGRYPFYCKNRLLFLQSHREMGMEGVLDVVE